MANVRNMGSVATLGTKSIVANGTYNASSDNLDGFSQVAVNVPGSTMISGTSEPSSSQGSNGDTYIRYSNTVNIELKTSIIGGYNGGAPLRCYVNDALILSATGNSPYNLDYDNKSSSYNILGHTINIEVIPPANSTRALVIIWSVDNVVVWTESIMPNGDNTSYGYNTEESHIEAITTLLDIITVIYYKQSGTWLTVGDSIVL